MEGCTNQGWGPIIPECGGTGLRKNTFRQKTCCHTAHPQTRRMPLPPLPEILGTPRPKTTSRTRFQAVMTMKDSPLEDVMPVAMDGRCRVGMKANAAISTIFSSCPSRDTAHGKRDVRSPKSGRGRRRGGPHCAEATGRKSKPSNVERIMDKEASLIDSRETRKVELKKDPAWHTGW